MIHSKYYSYVFQEAKSIRTCLLQSLLLNQKKYAVRRAALECRATQTAQVFNSTVSNFQCAMGGMTSSKLMPYLKDCCENENIKRTAFDCYNSIIKYDKLMECCLFLTRPVNHRHLVLYSLEAF